MKRIIAATLTVSVLLLTAKSQAGTDTWNQLSGGNASGSWNTAANPPWSTGALPGATDTADFSTVNITADSTVTLDGNQSINALIFGDTTTTSAAGWILSPGTPATSTLTLSGTTPTITVNALGTGKVATISAVLAGTAGLIKAGTGTLTLSASNTYSGGTTFSNTLIVGAQGALGTGSVTGTSPAILQFNTPANATFTNALTLAAPDANSINNQSTTATITLNGNIVATAPNYFTIVGQGANNAGFVLGGSNVCSTRFVLKNAALTLASNNAVIASTYPRISLGDEAGSGASVYLANGVTESLKVVDANNNAITGAVFTVGMQSAGVSTFSGTGSSGVAVELHSLSTGGTNCAWNFEADSGATVTFSGIILNTGSNTNLPIAKTGAGTVVFSATNTYAGATTIQNGTLTGVVGCLLYTSPSPRD